MDVKKPERSQLWRCTKVGEDNRKQVKEKQREKYWGVETGMVVRRQEETGYFSMINQNRMCMEKRQKTYYLTSQLEVK